MEYVSFAPGIEVRGAAIGAIIDGFGIFRAVAAKALIKHGLAKRGSMPGPSVPGPFLPGNDAPLSFDLEGWYPLENWLNFYREVASEIGETALFRVGQAIPKNGNFPADIGDVHAALASLDAVYHLHHRKQGQVMFDPQGQTMLEGIGHYGYERAGDRRVVCPCENPFPCVFDHGIITAMAQRFAPRAAIAHAPGPCRRKGSDRCTYVVTW